VSNEQWLDSADKLLRRQGEELLQDAERRRHVQNADKQNARLERIGIQV
jgi:hypothetical protein